MKERESAAKSIRNFFSFWPMKDLAELAAEPSLYVRSQGEGICFVSSANQQSILLYK
jgi:hypothetical protein